MKISPINNQTFGAIVLRDKRVLPAELLKQVEEVSNGKFHANSLENKSLIKEVIRNDYNTSSLWGRWNELVNSQKNNPVNIYLDLFSPDEEIPLYASGWYQKATVHNKTFKQQFIYFQKQQSPIKFLERACKYANFLKFLGYKQ